MRALTVGFSEYDSADELRRLRLMRGLTRELDVATIQRLTGLHLDACPHSVRVRSTRDPR